MTPKASLALLLLALASFFVALQFSRERLEEGAPESVAKSWSDSSGTASSREAPEFVRPRSEIVGIEAEQAGGRPEYTPAEVADLTAEEEEAAYKWALESTDTKTLHEKVGELQGELARLTNSEFKRRYDEGEFEQISPPNPDGAEVGFERMNPLAVEMFVAEPDGSVIKMTLPEKGNAEAYAIRRKMGWIGDIIAGRKK